MVIKNIHIMCMVVCGKIYTSFDMNFCQGIIVFYNTPLIHVQHDM